MSKKITRSVSTYPQLEKWLSDHNACFMWAHDGDKFQPSVQGWLIGPSVAIIVLQPDRHGAPGGWDIATTLNTNSIAETLHDANVRLGCPTAEDPRKTL